MRTLAALLLGCSAAVSTAHAGGVTAWAEIKVDEIDLGGGRVTIVGSGSYFHRVISVAKDAKDSAYGKPAQLVEAKAEKVAFVLYPDHAPNKDIIGVPTGEHSEKEVKELSDKMWPSTYDEGKRIRVGDSIRINYQGNKSLYVDFRIKEVHGYGTIQIVNRPEEESKGE